MNNQNNPKCPKWKLKSCPKCRGDMYFDYDEYACLQCGYTEPVNIDDVLQRLEN